MVSSAEEGLLLLKSNSACGHDNHLQQQRCKALLLLLEFPVQHSFTHGGLATVQKSTITTHQLSPAFLEVQRFPVDMQVVKQTNQQNRQLQVAHTRSGA